MANNEFTIPIPARLKNVAKGGHVAGASDIVDDVLGKEQSVINQEVSEAIEGNTEAVAAERQRAVAAEGALDNRLSDVEELAEISIDGGEAKIATGEDFTNPDATKRAKIPTVGAIVDGLNDGVYDVSKRNPTAGPNSDGKFTLDYILSNANTLIPTGWRHGGMSIKFVQSSDNKYVQYFLTKDEWSLSEADWQKMNLEEEVSQIDQYVRTNCSIYDDSTTEIITENIITGKYININGFRQDNTSYNILVFDVASYVGDIVVFPLSYDYLGYTIKRADDSKISWGSYSQGSVRIPENAATIELSYPASDTKHSVSIIQQSVVPVNTAIKAIRENMELFGIQKISLSITDFVNSNTIISSSGNIYTDAIYSAFKTTDYIAIDKPIVKILAKGYFTNSTVAGFVFYDIQKRPIKCIYGLTTNELVLTAEDIPSNAKYIVACVNKNDVPSPQIVYTTYDLQMDSVNYNIRPIIRIYNTDTENEIVDKLFAAYYLGGCDVIWENGTYQFTNAFDYIHTNYNGDNHNELPIGNDNRYFFNGSTIIGTKTSTDATVISNESLFGTQRKAGGFELYDATLIANDLVYVVHDESTGKLPYGKRMYKNIKMQYNTIQSTNPLRKCIGGGNGRNQNIVIDGCVFITDNTVDVSYHGIEGTLTEDAITIISISNSHFSNGLSFDNLNSEHETGEIKISACSFVNLNVTSLWTLYSFCNDIRS